MKIRYSIFLFCFFCLIVGVYSQKTPHSYNILFYNTENLFDTLDDPVTADEEFTPQGLRHWTNKRFNRKINNLAKVILNSSGWDLPIIIGLCEIENRHVLEMLLMNTPLNSFPFNIIHKDSPDGRGIDVALLYNEDLFYPVKYKYLPLIGESNSVIKTREILYVSGVVDKIDTVHIFLNHWSSRYGGLLETRPMRILAAKTLNKEIKILSEKHVDPKIVIMGDFNDQPCDISISRYLKTAESLTKIKPEAIYNLSVYPESKVDGTIKYRGHWSVFDQIIVSGTLLETDKGLITMYRSASIVELPFLFTKDEKYGGLKLNRTYMGYKYKGGFSDHLPVMIKLSRIP